MIGENLNTLHAIERSMARTWREHPEMTDHVAGRIYERLAAHYRALATGREPVGSGIDGLEGEVYDNLLGVCEGLREHGAPPIGSAEKNDGSDPVDAETLHRCLRRLMRSVKKGTKRGGVHGYLDLIARHTR